MSKIDKVALLTTSFPLLTETFVQREVRKYLSSDLNLEVHSIWRGEKKFEKWPIHRFQMLQLIHLLFWIPYWSILKPSSLLGVLKPLFIVGCTYFQNWEENLLGIAFGIIKANDFKNRNIVKIHTIWATMPTSAALTIYKLTGIPYSMEGHAYDVFRGGGDCLLGIKLKHARIVRTSCSSTYDQLLNLLNKDSTKLLLIRRGLETVPTLNSRKIDWNPPFRILSVGRLTAKKGYPEQFAIYKAMQRKKIAFTVKIIGGGELEKPLRNLIKKLQLEKEVQLLGAQPFSTVENFYKESQFFFFTGKIADNGDRDGFPNVLGEAMARGLIVCSSPVADVCSAIDHGRTGFLCDIENPEEWIEALLFCQKERSSILKIQEEARSWIEEHFLTEKNTKKLLNQVLGQI